MALATVPTWVDQMKAKPRTAIAAMSLRFSTYLRPGIAYL